MPLCPTGRPMRPAGAFTHPEGSRTQEFRCPLLHPQPSGQTCAHEQFAKGSGCVTDITIERGGLRSVLLDRAAAPYKDIYRQRTCTERINAQATDLGIERPNVRNAASVRTLNTLTYVLINLRALPRVRAAKEQRTPPQQILALC